MTPELQMLPQLSISCQAKRSSTLSSGVQPTNTLIITQVPAHFFQPKIFQALRNVFAVYGEIEHWVPISCFSRILLVYREELAAEQAKTNSDPLLIKHHEEEAIQLRVYRAEPNRIISPTSQTKDRFLKPPPVEKNFLISPPGSPPVGWEQIREDPPNSATLAEDLIAALNNLQCCKPRRNSREVLLQPEEGVGVGVYVEDCDGVESDGDGDQEVDWEYGTPNPSRMQWKPAPTAMPPTAMTLR